MNTCGENIQKFYGIDSKVYSVHVHSAQKNVLKSLKSFFFKDQLQIKSYYGLLDLNCYDP